MPSPSPAHLATVRRGTALEAVIRGHVVVVDSDGTVLSAVGDATAVTTLRSCVKPLQALPLVRDAADEYGISTEEIAIACSSHSGEPVHVEVVARLLRRLKLGEEALTCGPQLPMDADAAAAVVAAGTPPSRLTNNCSGKHAGMLAACASRGWPVHGYADFDHPLQSHIRAIMGALGGIDLNASPVGIDGCGLPTHGVPLAALARMFAAAQGEPAFLRCQDAMAAHPHLVAGRDRLDTAVLAVAGERLTVKGGAAGVWIALRRPDGPALALKLESGTEGAVPAVALAALAALGWIGRAALEDPMLRGFSRPVLRNWAGTAVGEITPEAAWMAHLAA